MATSTTAATDTVVRDVLNFQATSTEDQSASTGSYFAAQGDTAEQSGYLTAQDIAEQNASLEKVSGSIQQAQQEREVNQSLGTQQAAVASAGFGSGGSALALLRSSRQQGYLAEQLTGVQSDITAGGFIGQAAAAKSEASAAGIAASAATTLAATEAAQGQLMHSYAAAEAGALQKVTGNAGSPGGAVWNGVSWTLTPATPASTGSDIASSVANGGTLSPGALASAAVSVGGGPAATPTWNGVSWSG